MNTILSKHLDNIQNLAAEAYSDAAEHCDQMVSDSPWDVDLMDRLEADLETKERALQCAWIHDTNLDNMPHVTRRPTMDRLIEDLRGMCGLDEDEWCEYRLRLVDMSHAELCEEYEGWWQDSRHVPYVAAYWSITLRSVDDATEYLTLVVEADTKEEAIAEAMETAGHWMTDVILAVRA